MGTELDKFILRYDICKNNIDKKIIIYQYIHNYLILKVINNKSDIKYHDIILRQFICIFGLNEERLKTLYIILKNLFKFENLDNYSFSFFINRMLSNSRYRNYIIIILKIINLFMKHKVNYKIKNEYNLNILEQLYKLNFDQANIVRNEILKKINLFYHIYFEFY